MKKDSLLSDTSVSNRTASQRRTDSSTADVKSSNKGIAVLAAALTLFVALCVVLGETLLAPSAKKVPIPFSDTGLPLNEVMLVAHRGFSSVAPENTLAAFTEAGEAGFPACEFDIRATTDGQWVVMHDDNVSRTTDGSAVISKSSLAELSECKVDCGSGIETFSNEKIPTLEQALEVCVNYGMKPFVEIKSYTEELLNQLPALLVDAMGSKEAFCVISFDRDALELLRGVDADLELILLSSKVTDKITDYCVENGFGLSFDHNGRNCLKAASAAAEKGVSLVTWTIDTAADAQTLIASGVTTLTTNCIFPK